MITVSSQQNKKKQFVINDNILESLRSLGSGVGRTLAKDAVSKISADVIGSFIAPPFRQGELKPNQSVEIPESPINVQSEKSDRIAPEYSRPVFKPAIEAGISQKIESLRQELEILSKSIASLNTEVNKAVMEIPVNPGIYHLNFLERLRTIIVDIRRNIDDSRTWLALSAQKNKQKKYWGMYKKHGTTFGLSHERSVSTQAG